MTAGYDLVFKGATVVDGLGNPAVTADVAVKDGRVAEIGRLANGNGAETVDADGLMLAPGMIDIHTHYDAQITWDPFATPSLGLGMTTVVIGNCGFGIAPCSPEFRDLAVESLAVVEGMDVNSLRAGVQWDFETFPEYLDMLRRQPLHVNVAAFVCHSPIRVAVMGEDAQKRAATEDEIGRMRDLVRSGMEAGAIGFSSSFSDNHEGVSGVPMPSRLAEIDELRRLVQVLGDVRRGVFMMPTGGRIDDPGDFLESLSRDSGRPAVLSGLFHGPAYPNRVHDFLAHCAEARGRDAEVYGQVSSQPVSMDFKLDYAYPLYSVRAWDEIRGADRDRLKAAFADSGFRRRFRESLENPKVEGAFLGDWDKVEVSMTTEENAELRGLTIAEIAEKRGVHPVDAFFDIGLAEDLDTQFAAALLNDDETAVGEIIAHDCGVVGLSDAGAHLTFMCNAGFGLHMLGHWVRELGAFDMPQAVRSVTSRLADAYRIPDRGRIAVGAHADLILFDPATVGITKNRRANDFPEGGSRLMRDPIGLSGVWVNGAHVFDGKDYITQDRSPGRLLDRFDA